MIMLSTPGLIGSAYFCHTRQQLGAVTPSRIEQIGSTHDPVRITRVSPRRVELETEGKFASTFEDLPFRRPSHGFEAGESYELAVGTLRVLEVQAEGRPTKLDLTLNQPPDAFDFAVWTERGFERFTLPPEGEYVDLPATSTFLMGEDAN